MRPSRRTADGRSWLDLVFAGAAGGAGVKGPDLLSNSWLRRTEDKRRSKEFLESHADPILKAADELVGKIKSLADADFRSIPPRFDAQRMDEGAIEVCNVTYLFAQLWARVEILLKESLHVRLAADKRGKRLNEFLKCLESRHVRLTDRARQRAIGEITIRSGPSGRDCMDFHEFVRDLATRADLRSWVRPVLDLVVSASPHNAADRASSRQSLLMYVSVVHALIDTLDPDHVTTKSRPSFPHKMTKQTKRELRFRVFRVYLDFVEGVDKYAGSR